MKECSEMRRGYEGPRRRGQCGMAHAGRGKAKGESSLTKNAGLLYGFRGYFSIMSRFPLFCAYVLVSCLPAIGEIEQWTRVDGRTADLELFDVRKEGEDTRVDFLTRAGKKVTLDLGELSGADQVRVKSWRPGANIKVQFLNVSKHVSNGKNQLGFGFRVQGEGFLDLVFNREPSGIIRPGQPEVLRLSLEDEPVSYKSCSAWLERDPFGGAEAPFVKKRSSLNVDNEGVLRVDVEGVPDQLDTRHCEFEAKLYFRQVSVPKEVEGVVEASDKLDELEYCQLGQFRVALQPFAEWDAAKETEAEAIARRGPQGYSVVLHEDADEQLVISKDVVINRERKGDMMVEARGSRFKVVIKYWSVVRDAPFIVKKAADEVAEE